jgi:autotransporter family porin
MVGTGKSTTKAASELTGHTAIGRVSGNSVGVYGTWYADAEQPTGLYVDSWAQYGRYKTEVMGQQLAKESYDSSTAAVSLEAGYALQLRDNGSSALFLEPQAQAIYSRYRSDDVTERDSHVQVRASNRGDVTTRVGARLYGHGTDASHNKVQPFLEANWWRSAQSGSVAFNGERMNQSLPKDRYEVKVGAELELGGGWTGWGHLGWQTGKQDYRNLDGLIGVKRSW